MQLDYHVVDVFTQVALEGNALAVFPDARPLNKQTMQRIARELNLSETAFIFPAQAGGAPYAPFWGRAGLPGRPGAG